MTTSVKGEDRLEEIANRVLAERRNADPLTPRDLADLIRRLGGEVRIPITDGLGPAGGDEPDNAQEHVKRWDGAPAIQQDAAAVLSALSAPSTKPDRESADEGALREALEFYAEPTNWSVDGSFLPADETGMRPMCGRRARQALSALSKDTEASAGEQQ